MQSQSSRSLSSRTPRDIDTFTKMTVLFGGIWTFMGFLFTGAFGFVFIMLFSLADTVKQLSDDGKWSTTAGTLQRIEQTNTTINDNRIYQYFFTYNADGRALVGSSYAPHNIMLSPNKPVTVEYKPNEPARARIQGMDESMLPWWMFLPFGIPFIVGIVFVIIGLRSNKKALNLLINGLWARGTMISKNVTNTRINRRMVYRYEFEFLAKNEQRHIAICRTHLTERVEDEQQEIILFDRENPDYNVVYDAIAVAPQINSRGGFERAANWRFVLFIAPLLCFFMLVLAIVIF